MVGRHLNSCHMSQFQGENAKQQPPELDGFVQNGPGQTIREKCSDLLMLGKLQKEAGLETSSERTAWVILLLSAFPAWKHVCVSRG